MTAIFAWAFVVLAPLVAGAARYTLQLRRHEPSGIATALAATMVAGAIVSLFLGGVSLLYVLGATDAVRILSPGVLPSFLILEVILLIVPLYLRLLTK